MSQGTRIFVEEDVHEIGLLPTGALAPCLDSSFGRRAPRVRLTASTPKFEVKRPGYLGS